MGFLIVPDAPRETRGKWDYKTFNGVDPHVREE